MIGDNRTMSEPMCRVAVALACVVAGGSSVALAQPPPAQQPPLPPLPAPPTPQPPPPPWQASPPPYGYAPPFALTVEEQQLLAEGEMPLLEHAGGGALAFVIGFGTGHILQGRWSDSGWKFTLGEGASLAAIIIGFRDFADCLECDNSRAGLAIAAGVIGVLGFHVWEVLDALIVPANRNKRVRDLRRRLGYSPVPQSYSLFFTPPRDGSGAIGGLSLRF